VTHWRHGNAYLLQIGISEIMPPIETPAKNANI